MEVRVLKSRFEQDCAPTGGARGKVTSLTFLASENPYILLPLASSSVFEVSSVFSLTASSSLSPSDICFPCRIPFSDSDPPFSCIRPLVIVLGLPTQSRIISLPQHL